MGKPTIITFSGQAGHGKDTSVKILKGLLEQQSKRVLIANYADHLKFLAAKYLNWDGSKNEKNRTILQVLGTERIKDKIPTYWVDTVIGVAKIFENDCDYILISDCRFPHEIIRWKEEGYKIFSVHLERPGFDNGLTDEQKNHPSETALNCYEFDVNIKAGTIDELQEQIKTVLCYI